MKASSISKARKKLSRALAGFLSLLFIFLPVSLGAQEEHGVLRVEIAGIKPAQGGAIIAALYNGKENWLKKKKTYAIQTIVVTGDIALIDFADIAYSDAYALFIFHDANGNHKLDFRIFPVPRPREGIGVSNNAVRFGKPYYEKARFSVNNNQNLIHISMHYES